MRPIMSMGSMAIAMINLSLWTAFMAVFLLPSGIAGQDLNPDATSSLDRFRLYTGCQNVSSVAYLQDEEDNLPDLSQRSLDVAMASRLRGARIFADTPAFFGSPTLYLFVHVVGRAYSTDLRFHKKMYDPVTGESWYASTWRHGSTGTHGTNGQFVRGAVSELMDEFINEYLRVNDEACAP